MHGLKRLWGWISPPTHHTKTVGDLVTPEQLLAFEPGLPVAIQSLTGDEQWDARGVRTQQFRRHAAARFVQCHALMLCMPCLGR
jgi:hypothetical protein